MYELRDKPRFRRLLAAARIERLLDKWLGVTHPLRALPQAEDEMDLPETETKDGTDSVPVASSGVQPCCATSTPTSEPQWENA